MFNFLSRFSPQIYAALRIVAGLMFMFHGSQKLLRWPPEPQMPNPLPPLLVVAGWIEMVGGAMIAVGLFTSLVAFICSGLMAAAYFMGHAPEGWNPVVNKGELAVLYCFLFLFMAAYGSGAFSLDGLIRRRPNSSST